MSSEITREQALRNFKRWTERDREIAAEHTADCTRFVLETGERAIQCISPAGNVWLQAGRIVWDSAEYAPANAVPSDNPTYRERGAVHLPLSQFRSHTDSTRQPEVVETVCPDCFLVHAGECY